MDTNVKKSQFIYLNLFEFKNNCKNEFEYYALIFVGTSEFQFILINRKIKGN